MFVIPQTNHSFSTPVSGKLSKIYLYFQSFFISILQRWRSLSAGCPCLCHVGSICCNGQRGLTDAVKSVSEKRIVCHQCLMHCLQDRIWPSKMRKPINILVHFLDIAVFPLCVDFSPLVSLVWGTQKYHLASGSLGEFPCDKMDHTH